jgi:DNA-directed RNA polymerase specialized sigma24 family protein
VRVLLRPDRVHRSVEPRVEVLTLPALCLIEDVTGRKGGTACALLSAGRKMRTEAREFGMPDEVGQKSNASLSPFDHRGQVITPPVLSAAEEISRRAIRHAERVSIDPAVAANLLEEAAAAVSRALRARCGNEAPVTNLEAYLFRAFLRRLNKTKKRQLRLDEAISSLGSTPKTLDPRRAVEMKILVDEFLMKCDPEMRDVLYRRIAGSSWKEIGCVYQISSHAAESKFSRAFQKIKRQLGLK